MDTLPIKVDLGCGMRKAGGWIGIDIRKFEGVDYVMDIGKDKLPFEDNSVDEMKAIHVLEHLYSEQLFFFIDEAYRVLKPTGFFHIEVPIFGTLAWRLHPDHKMQWTKDMVGFFQVPADIDHHGYLKGFWHIEFLESNNIEALHFNLFPNKKGIERYTWNEKF
jgi:predicted SAM-dependent methyltransferase